MRIMLFPTFSRPMTLVRALIACTVLIGAGGEARAITRLDLLSPLEIGQSGWLTALISRFNTSQSDVAVHLVAGHDGEKAPIALREASDVPVPGSYQPIDRILRGAGVSSKALLPELASSVADARGRLQALPLGLSTTVLFYNKAAFRAAGLDPEVPPRTWMEVQQAADKLFDAGSRCPFSTTRPATAMIEQMSAWHGLPIFSRGRLVGINGLLQVKHVALMSSWYKSRFFANFGRLDEADERFAQGECGLITTESHMYPRFVAAGVDVGVAPLPVHEDVRGAPKYTLVDGLALWVRSGLAKGELRALTRFLRFLMTPETQVHLVRDGGFLPFSKAGIDAVLSRSLDKDLPQQHIALAQIKGGGGTMLARRPQLRQVVDEELEAVWANRKPAKEALDTAANRAQSGR